MDEEFYNIPTLDNGVQRMSRQEIIDEIETSPTPRFDAAIDVIYRLHTRMFPAGVPIQLNNINSLSEGGWNPLNPVRITIHGWNSDRMANVNAVDEYLAVGDFNHIVVDWSAGSMTNYISARNRIYEVANQTALLATFLVTPGGSSYSNINVVGHSLGGQMAGLIGQNLGGNVLGGCVALDPAGPLFSSGNINDRISPDDCVYVQGVHTNAGFVGFGNPIGHADFYPNGGRKQPNCGFEPIGLCSHGRSAEYLKVSLNDTMMAFEAWQCTTELWDVQNEICKPSGAKSTMLGEPIDKTARGLYHLKTTGLSPYVEPLYSV